MRDFSYDAALNEDGTEFDIVKAAEIATEWSAGYRGLAERMHEVWLLSGRPDPFDHDMEAWRGFALAVRAALASSPAPAGLDVDDWETIDDALTTAASYTTEMQVNRDRWIELRDRLRAATRPAEDAG